MAAIQAVMEAFPNRTRAQAICHAPSVPVEIQRDIPVPAGAAVLYDCPPRSTGTETAMLARAMFLAVLAGATGAHAQEGPIIHDGEYNFLRAQFGERWDAQDVEIDARLSEIRDANDGKPPNIL